MAFIVVRGNGCAVTRKVGLAPAYRMKRWLRISQVFGTCHMAGKEAIDSISAGANPALRKPPGDVRVVGRSACVVVSRICGPSRTEEHIRKLNYWFVSQVPRQSRLRYFRMRAKQALGMCLERGIRSKDVLSPIGRSAIAMGTTTVQGKHS